MALGMIVGALQMSALPTRAENLVCGDGDREVPEQCDDGNLQNGDGCSSTCTVELCGNLSMDQGEQCDDGNLQNNDGCNRYCQIEFCGDRVIQETRGEQCDDGNGISGDGCTGSCMKESSGASSSIASSFPSQSSLPSTTIVQAKQALAFLNSGGMEEYKEYVSSEEMANLTTIVKKKSVGANLNAEERQWAGELSIVLLEAQSAESARYAELLQEFMLQGGEEASVNQAAIKLAGDLIRRMGLSNAVLLTIERLKLQGIDLTENMPEGFLTNLTPQSRPVSVLQTLKTLRDISDTYATKDVPASLRIIERETLSLQQALPLFALEYGLDVQEAELLLSAILNERQHATKDNLVGLITAINHFIAFLEKNAVISRADIASFGHNTAHAAASAQRIADLTGNAERVLSDADVLPFLESLAASAPSAALESFARGTVTEQRSALLEFLSNDKRTIELRATLRNSGHTGADARFESLVADLMHIGENNDTDSVCDDSVSDGLTCVHQYLSDLEHDVRQRSFFTKLIGNLQDFFGIGT